MKQVRIGMWFMAIGITLFVGAQCIAQTIPVEQSKHPQKGCTFVLNMNSTAYSPVSIVGERQAVDDDDKPVEEWLVMIPGTKYRTFNNEDGVLSFNADNLPKKRVLLSGQVRMIGSSTAPARKVQCPD